MGLMKDEGKPVNVQFGSQEHLEWSQVCVFEHTKLLQECHDNILDPKDQRAMTYAQSMMSLFETSRSVLLLCRNNLRDSYSLGRVVFELVLNLGYYDCKDGMIEKAHKHAHQKMLRDQFRIPITKKNDVEFHTQTPNNLILPEPLQRAFEEFTNSKGKEIRTWTGDPKDNIYRKIQIIKSKHGKAAEVNLNLSLFFIYRHASETIHGTLFGTMFGIGLTENVKDRPKNNDDVKKYIVYRNTLLLRCLNNLLNLTIDIVGGRFEIEGQVKKSHQLRNELADLTD